MKLVYKEKGKLLQSLKSRSLQVFLSYSSSNRRLAGIIKRELENLGINVFLAHDDILPSSQSQESILKALEEADVFLPLLTTEFKRSEWANQEIGVAVAQRKLIIPLKIDVNPSGFIVGIQAYKFKYKADENLGISLDLCRQSCFEVVKLISDRSPYGEQIKQGLIEKFALSNTWSTATGIANVLDKYDSFTIEEVKEIIEASINNNQIHGSYNARPFLRRIIKDFRHLILTDKLSVLKEFGFFEELAFPSEQ